MKILYRVARDDIPQKASLKEVREIWGRAFQEVERANAKALVGRPGQITVTVVVQEGLERTEQEGNKG